MGSGLATLGVRPPHLLLGCPRGFSEGRLAVWPPGPRYLWGSLPPVPQPGPRTKHSIPSSPSPRFQNVLHTGACSHPCCPRWPPCGAHAGPQASPGHGQTLCRPLAAGPCSQGLVWLQRRCRCPVPPRAGLGAAWPGVGKTPSSFPCMPPATTPPAARRDRAPPRARARDGSWGGVKVPIPC